MQQPWAWAIIHGGKDIENRTRAWRYRGPLAIHAGKRWSDRGAESALVKAAYETAYPVENDDEDYPFPRGAIIGTVELLDVHPDAGCCRPWGESHYLQYPADKQLWRRGLVHLVLTDPRPCDPIGCNGALSLWTVPDDIAAQLLDRAPP